MKLKINVKFEQVIGLGQFCERYGRTVTVEQNARLDFTAKLIPGFRCTVRGEPATYDHAHGESPVEALKNLCAMIGENPAIAVDLRDVELT